MKWEVVIGLETHAQLLTRSKMFSGASTAFGAEPNTQASAVDVALRDGSTVRIRPIARSASTPPRRSPSISASIIAVADWQVMLLATEPSLMPADSSALPSRWISEVRAWTVFVRYRVRSRTSFCSADGMNEPCSSPHSSNSAIRAQSRASVLCPFSALACAGLITATSMKSCSASA